MAKINIFIPVYNGEKYLEETIQSILSQTFLDFEAFFVDDGSSDGSVKILNKYSQIDSRIKVHEKKHEGNVPFSWNYIFPYLNGEWTLYMSHDDIIESNLLEQLMAKQAATQADVVIPSCCLFSKDIHPGESPEVYLENNFAERLTTECISGIEAFELMLDYTIPGFALWNTSTIRRIGMPTESYNSDEGMQRLWVRECAKVTFSSAKFYYRTVANSITKGLKPYHYNSLLTHKRLLEAAQLDKLSPWKVKRHHYYCMSSLLYLKAQFRNKESSYSESEKKNITNIFRQVYPSFAKKMPFPHSFKECLLYICSFNQRLLNISAGIFSRRLRG